MKNKLVAAFVVFLSILVSSCGKQETDNSVSDSVSRDEIKSKYEISARDKMKILEDMMQEAQTKGIDVTREETIMWFSDQFLTFANWDEANQSTIEAAFNYERYFAPDKAKLAEELPDLERKKVIEILDNGIKVLGEELKGEIQRRPVRKVDWQNTKAGDNMFVNSKGQPTFPYDYFSKTVGQPLTNPDVYNDHLGAIYHGGENLYPVDHDRAINSFLVKEDGSFDQELLKEVTQIPDTNIGFLIYWLMGIPEWVEQREPEIRKGRSLFQGFDLDNPLAREIWGKILRYTTELTKDKKISELGYILANEPHWFSEEGHWTAKYAEMNDISSYTLGKFQKWLENKYKSKIQMLNANWGTQYKTFYDIEFDVPIDTILRGEPIWYDWSRFNMYRSTEFFTFMQDEIHSIDPTADTHIKIWPSTFYEDSRSHGIDVEALTELTTMIGHDAKALGGPSIRSHISSDWLKKYVYNWKGMAILHDFLESVAPDKININSESHFLSSGQWKTLDARASYVRNVYWLATLQGMDANMGWFWARDPDGSPEDRLEGELDFFDPGLAGAFAGSNNMQPHIANEVTQVMFDLNSFSEEIIALREQRRPLRLFYSETSAINSNDYMTQQNKLYESLFFEGFPIGFATQNIIQKQDNQNWDVVLIYQNHYVTDNELGALQSYLDKGGVIILSSQDDLSMNEYGKTHTSKLKQSNGKLLILESDSDLKALRTASLNHIRRPDIFIKEMDDSQHKTIHWRSVEQDDGSYLVNIFNLGHEVTKIQLSLQHGPPVLITNLLTNNQLSSSFEMPSEDVLLLRVEVT